MDRERTANEEERLCGGFLHSRHLHNRSPTRQTAIQRAKQFKRVIAQESSISATLALPVAIWIVVFPPNQRRQ
eukprot:scaffold888_cov208-Alexandrium_tamarense.AAC.8